MKTIGLIGGISWQSTIEYYRIINEYVARRLGAGHSAKIIVWSIDFSVVDEYISTRNLEGLASFFSDRAASLVDAGADMILIGANTMHIVAPEVIKAVKVPVIHIVDALVAEIKKKNLTHIGLMGTKFTMEHPFYKDLLNKAGLEVEIPDRDSRDFIHQTIITELFRGYKNPESKKKFLEIIEKLKNKGAQGIILGCTEIPLLIGQGDCDIPVFDSTTVHAMAAVEYAFSESI